MVLFNMEQWVFISEAGGSKITDFWDFDTRHLNEHLMPSHIYIYLFFLYRQGLPLSDPHSTPTFDRDAQKRGKGVTDQRECVGSPAETQPQVQIKCLHSSQNLTSHKYCSGVHSCLSVKCSPVMDEVDVLMFNRILQPVYQQ